METSRKRRKCHVDGVAPLIQHNHPQSEVGGVVAGVAEWREPLPCCKLGGEITPFLGVNPTYLFHPQMEGSFVSGFCWIRPEIIIYTMM